MDGVINVLKPAGITSRQITSIIKRITKSKKAGHGGTLDPGAAGVLPVMIGKATRLFDILGEESKEYIGEIHFGIATDTQDSYGKTVKTEDVTIYKEQLELVLPLFIGKITQTPSIYSAIRIDGKRAYDYAFSGESVELPSRVVEIFELELLHQTADNCFLVRVLCSKGTYIRSLCEDIAKQLNTCAYLSFLLRTKTGRFSIENSITLDELENYCEDDHLTYVEDILEFLPKMKVKDEYTTVLHSGNKLPLDCCEVKNESDSYLAVYDFEDNFCGIGIKDEDVFRIKINFRRT